MTATITPSQIQNSPRIIKSKIVVEPSTTPVQHLLLHYLKQHGAKIHLIEYETGHKFTYKNLYDDCMKLAYALKKLSVNEGETLLVYGYNSYECFLALLAGLVVGAVVITMRGIDSIYEVMTEIDLRDVKCLFVAYEKREVAFVVKNEMPSVKNVIIMDNLYPEDDSSIHRLKTLIRDSERSLREEEIYDPKGNKDTIAMIMESSGITGPAKGVLLGHYDLATALCRKIPGLEVGENDVFSGHSFIAHLSGLFTHFLSIVCQARIVSFRTPKVNSILEATEKYKISWALFTPSYINLINQSETQNNLSSLTHVFVSGSRLTKQNSQIFQQKLKCKLFCNVYATTEATSLVTIAINNPNVESIGKVAAGVEVKIIDQETGALLGPNAVGEICVKGVIKFKGYHKNEEAKNIILDKEGWLHTCDIGYFDNDENFYIIDRAKDIIRQRGYCYSPADVEDVILRHQAVKEAAVVGIAIGVDDEISHAFVVIKNEYKDTVTEEQIQEFVNGKVSEMRKIKGSVHFVENIPKTDFGKVLRRKLSEEYKHLKASNKESNEKNKSNSM